MLKEIIDLHNFSHQIVCHFHLYDFNNDIILYFILYTDIFYHYFNTMTYADRSYLRLMKQKLLKAMFSPCLICHLRTSRSGQYVRSHVVGDMFKMLFSAMDISTLNDVLIIQFKKKHIISFVLL